MVALEIALAIISIIFFLKQSFAYIGVSLLSLPLYVSFCLLEILRDYISTGEEVEQNQTTEEESSDIPDLISHYKSKVESGEKFCDSQ